MLLVEVSKCWKVVQFQKNSIKMKSCKTLYEAQTAIRLKETIQAPRNPPPSGKTLLRLWNKIFLTEIYEENVFSDAVQIFFWQETETCLLENLQS